MKIEDVITETIIAIYKDSTLSPLLFLKGGAAMRLFDRLETRLSIDADFSLSKSVGNEKVFFGAIGNTLKSHFAELSYEVIDFKPVRKPKISRIGYPDWWGGWSCEFKLVAFKYHDKTTESKRRYALKPEGRNSPKISLDISEFEYCGRGRTKTKHGVRIHGYTREILWLEKLRAICQQHPEYAYRLSKNRARDFYDIYELTINEDDSFVLRCRKYIKSVFMAKEVPLSLLGALWNEAFIDEQSRGFDLVRDTVDGTLQEFDVYVEHLRFLVREICPDLDIN